MAQKRPSKKTSEIVDEIMNGIADGTPLREICRREGMPNWRTVNDWLEADEEMAARFARAREIGFDAIAEDILSNVDNVKAISEHIQRSKLRVDARKWAASKLKPGTYGEKLALDHSGALNVTIGKDDAAL